MGNQRYTIIHTPAREPDDEPRANGLDLQDDTGPKHLDEAWDHLREEGEWASYEPDDGVAYANGKDREVHAGGEPIVEPPRRRLQSTTAPVSLEAGRRQLDGLVRTAIDAVVARPDRPPEVHAIRVTLGGGKTWAALYNAIIALVELRARGDLRVIVMAVPEHELSAEIAKRFNAMADSIPGANGLRIAIWRGREAKDPDRPGEKMCQNGEEVRNALALLADIDKDVCSSCPFNKGCAYLGQKGQEADFWIVGHPLLFHGLPKAIGSTSGSEENPIAFLVVDESLVLTGFLGLEGHGIEITLDSLDDGVMPVPDGDALSDGRFLKAQRELLKRALVDELDGPVRREALAASTFNPKTARTCRDAEWRRKVDAGPWQERQDNRTIKPMVELWRAVERLTGPDGPNQSGCIELTRNKVGARILKITGLFSIDRDWRVPTLLIDALLEPDLVRRFWPSVRVLPEIEIETPFMTVRQTTDRAFSQAMLKPFDIPETVKGQERKDLEQKRKRREKNRRKLKACILRIDRNSGGPTLVVGNKAVIKAMALPPHIHVAWFNAVAGRDTWTDASDKVIRGEDLRTIIVVGRPQPKIIEAERRAAALTGAAVDHVEDECPKAPVDRLLRVDGEIVAVAGEARRHPDPTVELICWLIAVGQTMQTIGRGRGVTRTAENPLDVFVLSDVVLPIPVDAFIPNEAVMNPTVAELQLAEGGIAFSAGADAVAAYPNLWPNAAAFRKALQRENEEAGPANSVTFPYRKSLIRESHADPGTNLSRVTYQRVGPKLKRQTAIIDTRQISDARAKLERRLGPLSFFHGEPVATVGLAAECRQEAVAVERAGQEGHEKRGADPADAAPSPAAARAPQPPPVMRPPPSRPRMPRFALLDEQWSIRMGAGMLARAKRWASDSQPSTSVTGGAAEAVFGFPNRDVEARDGQRAIPNPGASGHEQRSAMTCDAVPATAVRFAAACRHTRTLWQRATAPPRRYGPGIGATIAEVTTLLIAETNRFVTGGSVSGVVR